MALKKGSLEKNSIDGRKMPRNWRRGEVVHEDAVAVIEAQSSGCW